MDPEATTADIYTYLHKYIQNIQIYSTVIAKTQIGAQGENPEQRFQDGYHMVKFETRGQNLRNFLRPHTNSLKLVITIDRNQFVPFSESSELKSPIFVEKWLQRCTRPIRNSDFN